MLSYINNKEGKNELVLCKINYDNKSITDKLMNINDISERMNIMRYINLSEKYNITRHPFDNDYSIITDLFDRENINKFIDKLKRVFAIKDDNLFLYELTTLSKKFARFYLDFHNLIKLEEIRRYDLENVENLLSLNKESYGVNNFTMNVSYIIYSAELYTDIINIINQRKDYSFDKVKVKEK